MSRRALAVIALACATATPVAAEPTQIGLWFGPRVFSSDSLLGYIDDAPFHPHLQNGIEFGPRVARDFFPWLVPELEIAMAPVKTDAVGGADAASVFWMEPRLQFRFELLPHHRVMPFIVVGGGADIALSSAKMRFANDIYGEGYGGVGVRIDTRKGFGLRLDARVSIVPGINNTVDPEFDFGLGIEFHAGEHHAPSPEQIAIGKKAPPPDRDGDGIPDAQDACPDRPEDFDGFEDGDGCPDIDNDLDRVLDIADKCPNVPETYNGFEDDDGCPDTVPPDVDALRGSIEGLLYADGETAVHDSAQASLKKIAGVMMAHPSIRVVLIGHTDDREAKQFAPPHAEGDAAPDLVQLSEDLGRARAEAVKQAMIAVGVPGPRIDVDTKGAEEPLADNDKPRGRLANRRVEIKLFVPVR
ncbi:MAG TPA: OmpA family protein [Kofleriaceae bacterium]|jgi:outer membrane protein OmpA-like peptidoglycan-associated protein